MKYLKYSLLAFIVTFFCSFVYVNAAGTYKAYAGIEIPALKGDLRKGPHTKTERNIQHYNNTGTINLCNGNENGIQVRVYSEADGYSAWLTVAGANQNGAWANSSVSTTPRAYNLYLQNNTNSVCKASHSGTWYLDKSAYDLVY